MSLAVTNNHADTTDLTESGLYLPPSHLGDLYFERSYQHMDGAYHYQSTAKSRQLDVIMGEVSGKNQSASAATTPVGRHAWCMNILGVEGSELAKFFFFMSTGDLVQWVHAALQSGQGFQESADCLNREISVALSWGDAADKNFRNRHDGLDSAMCAWLQWAEVTTYAIGVARQADNLSLALSRRLDVLESACRQPSRVWQ